MKQSYYLALTIGPIYKTLALAKRTRELWAASYIFSYLMEQIVVKLDADKRFEIILPVMMNKPIGVKIGAGLYPDRLIVKSKEPKSEKVLKKIVNDYNDVLDQVGNELITEINNCLGFSDTDFLVNYFQLYTLQIILRDDEDPIKSIFPLLDTFEQQPGFNLSYTTNILKKFLESKALRDSFLYKDAYEEKDKYRFSSVLAIATQDLRKSEKFIIPELLANYKTDLCVFDRIFEYCFENEGNEIEIDNKKRKVDGTLPVFLLKKTYNYKKGEEIIEQFQNYHKYMAVIQADGDDMGILLRALFEYGGTEAIQSFSGFLIEFGYEASQMIKDYDGVPVYLGGDDMLFFAPTKNGDRNIFMLVDRLDKLFKDSLIENTLVLESIAGWNKGMERDKKRKKVGLPTISYGIAISYHKYPLKEAIEAARSLLFDTAKHLPGKNAISFRLLKHSGHHIGASFNKHWRTWEAFDELLNDKDLNENFLSSIQFNLEPLRPVFKRILTGRKIDFATANFKELSIKFLPDEATREFLLKNLSDNFYNEGGSQKESREFIETVLALLLQTYRDMEDSFGNNPDTADRAIDTVYACLRMMQFYKQPDNKEDEE